MKLDKIYETEKEREVPTRQSDVLPNVERILCCSVLTANDKSRPRFFRHPCFSYEESVSWPLKGWEKLSCWYCGYPWPTVDGEITKNWLPATIPISYDIEKDTWVVSGYFCSWSCAKRELLSKHGYGCGERTQLIDRLARSRFGYTSKDAIIPAPYKEILEKYCGEEGISIEEFRTQSTYACTTVSKPPFITQPQCYERHIISESVGGWSAQGLRARVNDAEAPTKDAAPVNNMYSQFISAKQKESRESSSSSKDKPTVTHEGTLLHYQAKKK